MARRLGRRRPPAHPIGDSRGSTAGRWPIRDGDGDPLAEVQLVLIDGSNLLHALDGAAGARGSGGVPATPASAIVGRIRGLIPAGVRVELLLDGRPSGVSGRLATGMTVRYSGRDSADSVIAETVSRAATEAGPASTWSILVVTDDRQLRGRIAAHGARSAGTAWLLRRLGSGRELEPRVGGRDDAGGGSGIQTSPRRSGGGGSRGGPGVPRPKAGTSFGHGRPPRQPRSPDRDEDD